MPFIQLTIIGLLTSLSSSYILMAISVLLSSGKSMSGKELIEQVILSAVLGILIGIISLVFEIENFSFKLQLCLHYIAITGCVMIIGYFGHWYNIENIFSILSIFIAESLIYVLTWHFINSLLKKDVEKINKSIQKRKKIL